MEGKRSRASRPLASAFTEENGTYAQPAASSLLPNGQVCATMHLCTIDPSLTGPYCEMPVDYEAVCHRAVRFGPRPGASGAVSTGAPPSIEGVSAKVDGSLDKEKALAESAGAAARQTTEKVDAAAAVTADAAKQAGALVKAVKDGAHKITSAFKDGAGGKPSSAPAAKTPARVGPSQTQGSKKPKPQSINYFDV